MGPRLKIKDLLKLLDQLSPHVSDETEVRVEGEEVGFLDGIYVCEGILFLQYSKNQEKMI